jgi:hypothetical protein
MFRALATVRVGLSLTVARLDEVVLKVLELANGKSENPWRLRHDAHTPTRTRELPSP